MLSLLKVANCNAEWFAIYSWKIIIRELSNNCMFMIGLRMLGCNPSLLLMVCWIRLLWWCSIVLKDGGKRRYRGSQGHQLVFRRVFFALGSSFGFFFMGCGFRKLNWARAGSSCGWQAGVGSTRLLLIRPPNRCH